MTRPAAGRFVSRGGDKLDAALEAFAIDVTGRRALDAGASTGGFTDCLLARGAVHVIAVDVAYGQLAWSLRNDERVTVLERTNIRKLDPATIAEPVSIVVGDLAFISLVIVSEALLGLAADEADLVLLVKPQFEAPRSSVEPGGVVRDPTLWREAMLRVAGAYRDGGCVLQGACASPLVGPAGNREFFLHLRRTGTDIGDGAIQAAVESAP
jgi:23S rRNA (cytidine1920-2'-O)/16S rRNA (cytidine1409-2'-O)-methyltransferase